VIHVTRRARTRGFCGRALRRSGSEEGHLPGDTGDGCAFRFAVLAQWFPSANTLVNQFAAVRIETY